MSDGALSYVTHGDPARDPILFLHGFMGSQADWSDVVGVLQSTYRCLCVDLPGHGRSVGLSGAYSMEDATGRLVDVLDREGIDRAHLVGYSMGGRTALHVAANHADRCRCLVLESASPGLATERERAERRQVDEERAVRIETTDFEAFLVDWYRQPLFETYRQYEGLLGQMIRSRRSNHPNELARSLREMGTGRQPSLWDRLDHVDRPTCILVGGLDDKYVKIGERMADAMPRSRYEVVPDAGHNVHAEVPETFTKILSDFLRHQS
ncbi:MAG: 2-succinyl-6-hydroxy-2,4-cyclohexadiene-1-carboxylate synthase [Rhodothermales bacterium]